MLDRFKLPIALSLLGLVLIIGGVFASGLNNQQPKYPKESLVNNQRIISVDVSGAVKRAGVYQLTESSRVEQAIEMAGGFAENVNQEYIAKYLNMAQKLSDGMKIYVPAAGENAPSITGSTSTQSKVNINTASQAELEALPGIGQSTALKIISSRPYQTIEDLFTKKAVGKSVYEKIKDQLVLY